MHARSGGWAQTGTLTGGNPQFVSMQAVFDVAGVHTVQIDNPDPPFGSTALATVIFDIQGVSSITRMVTLGNGVSVSGVADAIRVQVIDNTRAEAFQAIGVSYEIDILVAPRVRAVSAVPPVIQPRLLYAGIPCDSNLVFAPSERMDILVPRGVGAISVFVTAISSAVGAPTKARVSQRYDALPSNIVTNWYDPNVLLGHVPLIGSPNYIEIMNEDTANGMFASILFGVDG